jgi:hypothetical protein
MKKSILVITVTGLMAFTSAVVMAQEEPSKAIVLPYDTLQDVKLAKTDSAADYRKFTSAAETQISGNHATIVNLKARQEEPSEAASAAFKEKVLALERLNDGMKKRIAEADMVKTSSWAQFKFNFNRDMDNLDRALRDI